MYVNNSIGCLFEYAYNESYLIKVLDVFALRLNELLEQVDQPVLTLLSVQSSPQWMNE